MGDYESREFGLRLHQRLLSGDDPVASAELAQAFLDPLVTHLRQRYPRMTDEGMLYDAVADAVLNYASNPRSYVPEHLTLFGYLKMSAQGDLKNILDKERRRREAERKASIKAVELEAGSRNTLQEDNELEDVTNGFGDEDESAKEDILRKVREELPDTRDQRMLELMMDNVRKTEEFAKVLGIQDTEKSKQRKIVKQNKDRIKKRIQRLGIFFGD